MINIKKKIDFYKIILALITFISTSIVFLSIPVFFDYKSKESEIEKKFYKDFKINLDILGEITYNFLPRPHLNIKKANLQLNKNNKRLSAIQNENLKIFIPLKDFYFKINNISDVELNNTNFNFNFNDLNEFRNHLYYKISKPIKIKDSKLFYLDDKKNIIFISLINELEYSINITNKIKKLKIKGNIFDVNYSSFWIRDYNKPKQTINEINATDPDIYIKNIFNYENKSNFNGQSQIKFLNENIFLNYFFKDDKIEIRPVDEAKNQNIKLYSNIDLKPFGIDAIIDLKNKTSNFLIDNLLNYILKIDKDFLKNINGKLTLNLKDISNEVFDNGKINIHLDKNSLTIKDTILNIKNVGKLKSKFSYSEKEGDIIFSSKNILEINDKKEFAKKFQLNFKKVNHINRIYFDLIKNVDNGEISISNIHINEIDKNIISKEIYYIKNIQFLRSLLRKILA